MLFDLIPTKVHGYLDYLTAALLPVVPRVLGYDHTVTHLHDAVAGMTLVNALVTDYELGAVRVLPMKGHLATDVMTGVGLMVTAAAMDEEDPTPRSCMAGLGLYYLATALCTKTEPSDRAARSRRMHRRPGTPMSRYAAQVRPEAAEPATR